MTTRELTAQEQEFVAAIARMVTDRTDEANNWRALSRHWEEVATQQRARLDRLETACHKALAVDEDDDNVALLAMRTILREAL